MRRTDPKDSASAVVLLSQKNKNAFRELFKLYARDVYCICSLVLSGSYEVPDAVAETFIRLWGECESVTVDNFEDFLFTLSVGVCRSRLKRAAVRTEDKNIPEVEEIKNVPSFENIRKSLETFSYDAERPDARAVDFYNEMLYNLPEKNREIFVLCVFTTLDIRDIAKSAAVDEEFVKENLRRSYAYLVHQAKRADFMGYNFVSYIPRMDMILNAMVRTCAVPSVVWQRVGDEVGFGSDSDSDTKEKDEKSSEKTPIRVFPKVKKKLSLSAKRAIAIIAAVAIAFAITFAAVVIYKNNDKNADEPSLSRASNTVPDGVWDGSTGDKFESGSGTKDDPYIISDGAQLAYLAKNINSGNVEYYACYYALGGDIILNSTDTDNIFTPIGYRNSDEDYKYFCGEFDGRGYTISGLKTNTQSCSALFGYLNDGKIKNLNLVSCDISSDSYAGGIVGYYSAKSGSSGISSCDVSGNIAAKSYAGGIVGFVSVSGQTSSFSVEKCASDAAIKADEKSAGGIIGYIEVSAGEANINDCLNSGDISSNDNSGGIVGTNQLLGGSSEIKTCINVGKITCPNATYGAIAGISDGFSSQSRARIENCIYLDTSADKAVDVGENSYVNASAVTYDQFSQSIIYDGFDTDKVWNINSSGSLPSLR